VFNGVFDTSVPAFPLVGMFFVIMFIVLRRREFEGRLADGNRNTIVTVTGAVMVVLPLLAVSLADPFVSGSYVFAAAALTTCWVGTMAAIKPSTFRFLGPYLLAYLAAVGSVSVLTTAFGDPLAFAVAYLSSGLTWLMRLPVQWSSVNISFTAAGGAPVTLYISQECSGIASISIFLLLMALMHFDLSRPTGTTLLFAFGGAALFLVLNSLRVVGLIAGGILGGVDLMWSLHGWLGYVFYIVGYLLIILLYTRREKESPSSAPFIGKVTNRDGLVAKEIPWGRLPGRLRPGVSNGIDP